MMLDGDPIKLTQGECDLLLPLVKGNLEALLDSHYGDLVSGEAPDHAQKAIARLYSIQYKLKTHKLKQR